MLSSKSRYKLLNMKDEHDGEEYTEPEMFKSHADFDYFINWVYEIKLDEPNQKPPPCGQKSDIYKLLNMKDEHDGEEYTKPEMFKSHADFDYFINWVYEIKSDEPNEKPRPCGTEEPAVTPNTNDSIVELIESKNLEDKHPVYGIEMTAFGSDGTFTNRYSYNLIQRKNNDSIFVFGANEGHMIDRSVTGGGQANATGGNYNVVPIISTDYTDDRKSDEQKFVVSKYNCNTLEQRKKLFNVYHNEIKKIVTEFIKLGGKIVFPIKEGNKGSSIGTERADYWRNSC